MNKLKYIFLLIMPLILNAATNNFVVTDGGSCNQTNVIGTYVYSRTVHSNISGFDYQLYCHIPDNGWGISKFYSSNSPLIYVSYTTNYYSIGSTQTWKDVYNDIRFGSGDISDSGTYYIWTGLSGVNGSSGKINVQTKE